MLIKFYSFFERSAPLVRCVFLNIFICDSKKSINLSIARTSTIRVPPLCCLVYSNGRKSTIRKKLNNKFILFKHSKNVFASSSRARESRIHIFYSRNRININFDLSINIDCKREFMWRLEIELLL